MCAVAAVGLGVLVLTGPVARAADSVVVGTTSVTAEQADGGVIAKVPLINFGAEATLRPDVEVDRPEGCSAHVALKDRDLAARQGSTVTVELTQKCFEGTAVISATLATSEPLTAVEIKAPTEKPAPWRALVLALIGAGITGIAAYFWGTRHVHPAVRRSKFIHPQPKNEVFFSPKPEAMAHDGAVETLVSHFLLAHLSGGNAGQYVSSECEYVAAGEEDSGARRYAIKQPSAPLCRKVDIQLVTREDAGDPFKQGGIDRDRAKFRVVATATLTPNQGQPDPRPVEFHLGLRHENNGWRVAAVYPNPESIVAYRRVQTIVAAYATALHMGELSWKPLKKRTFELDDKVANLEAGWSLSDAWMSNLTALIGAVVAVASSADLLASLLGDNSKPTALVMAIVGLLSAALIALANTIVKLMGKEVAKVTVRGLVVSTAVVAAAVTLQVVGLGVALGDGLQSWISGWWTALFVVAMAAMVALSMRYLHERAVETLGKGVPESGVPEIPADALESWRAEEVWEEQLIDQRIRTAFGDFLSLESQAKTKVGSPVSKTGAYQGAAELGPGPELAIEAVEPVRSMF